MKRRITKAMLMDCYGAETYQLNRQITKEAAFKWLEEANRFLGKAFGAKRLMAKEKRLKELGW